MGRCLAALVLAALAGCETVSVEVGVSVPVGSHASVGAGTTVFTRPAGVTANRRVGDLLATEPVSVHLDDATRQPPAGLQLVCRDQQLRPSAILRVTEVRQSVVFAETVRGKPAIGDEVVEASPAYLREVEEKLAPR